MPQGKLRQAIAWEAAPLIYHREQSKYYRAKLKAARRIHKGWVKRADLPSNCEIRGQVRVLARTRLLIAQREEALDRHLPKDQTIDVHFADLLRLKVSRLQRL